MTRLVLGLAFVFLGCLAFSACKSACPGVEVDGVCEKACQDSLCNKGLLCVNNACRPPCSSNADCSSGQVCTPRTSDYGTPGSYCVGPSSATPSNIGAACTASAECSVKAGERCVAGACTFTCESHDDCVACDANGVCKSIGSCTGSAKDAEGNSVRLCEKDSFPRDKGQFGSRCPNGQSDCASGFTCVGTGRAESGPVTPGNIDAYCTKDLCSGDADCPSGFFCTEIRAPAPPCTDVCGVRGTGGLKPCIAATDVGMGKAYQCGAVTIVTTRCMHREFCAPCTDDADCLSAPHQVCAKDPSGEKICTVLCDDNVNSCPWGNAATCRTTDDVLGVPTCSHRFGSCHGTGKSCEPCVDEKDCPTGVCNAETFTNEHFCIDFDVTCTCPSGTASSCAGGGCPKSPEPALSTMACLGGDAYLGSSLDGRCVGAASGSGCWPAL